MGKRLNRRVEIERGVLMNHGKVMIIDYGLGNHQSVANALDFLGYEYIISNEEADIVKARAYILPGVGAFGEAMKNLNKLEIISSLEEQILERKKPILGICLGMQLMAEDSEEGGIHKGLGWISGHVVELESIEGNKIPHVGWNDIQISKRQPLFVRIEQESDFYFDHSYHFVCEDECISAMTWRGTKTIAAVQKDNIFGTQFHPEKSQNNGLKLFRCFLNYVEKIF